MPNYRHVLTDRIFLSKDAMLDCYAVDILSIVTNIRKHGGLDLKNDIILRNLENYAFQMLDSLNLNNK